MSPAPRDVIRACRRIVARAWLAVAASVVLAALTASATSVASAAAAGNGGPSQGKLTKLESVFNFWAVACPPKGACVAVGQTQSNEGVVVPVVGGRPSQLEAVPGVLGFGGVACPQPNECIATGQSLRATTVLVRIVDGKPLEPVAVPGAYLFAISCGSPRSCWATGESADQKHALFVHIVDFRVVKTSVLSGIYPGAFFGPDGNTLTAGTVYGPVPFCTSATSCLAVGSTAPYYSKSPGSGLIVSLHDGRLVRAVRDPGIAQLLQVVCPSVTTCLADGYPVRAGEPDRLVGILDGHPTGVVAATSKGWLATTMSGISCQSAKICYAASRVGLITSILPGRTPSVTSIVGVGGDSPDHLRFEGGFDQLSCVASSCLAAGGVYDPSIPSHALGVLYYFRG